MSSFLKAFYKIGFFELIFYIQAFFWTLFHKIPKNIKTRDIFQIFYIQFLRVPVENCKIVEITDNKLVTRCDNECFILNLSLRLGLDTRESCKKISEGACKYFLNRINKNIVFKRNYNHIRPKSPSCEEEIILKMEKH
ncbi:MAG: hypothetical protein ACTSRG_06510 [Candidatus Helarchaeota archaeon]